MVEVIVLSLCCLFSFFVPDLECNVCLVFCHVLECNFMFNVQSLDCSIIF